MNEKINLMLKSIKYFITVLDNNQQGHNAKFQRGGSRRHKDDRVGTIQVLIPGKPFWSQRKSEQIHHGLILIDYFILLQLI
jgi:hypothetical protein